MSRVPKPNDLEGDIASEAELAEISRRLRDLLAEGDLPRRPPPAAGQHDHSRAGLSILRFAGGFIVPALILVVIILVQALWN